MNSSEKGCEEYSANNWKHKAIELCFQNNKAMDENIEFAESTELDCNLYSQHDLCFAIIAIILYPGSDEHEARDGVIETLNNALVRSLFPSAAYRKSNSHVTKNKMRARDVRSRFEKIEKKLLTEIHLVGAILDASRTGIATSDIEILLNPETGRFKIPVLEQEPDTQSSIFQYFRELAEKMERYYQNGSVKFSEWDDDNIAKLRRRYLPSTAYILSFFYVKKSFKATRMKGENYSLIDLITDCDWVFECIYQAELFLAELVLRNSIQGDAEVKKKMGYNSIKLPPEKLNRIYLV